MIFDTHFLEVLLGCVYIVAIKWSFCNGNTVWYWSQCSAFALVLSPSCPLSLLSSHNKKYHTFCRIGNHKIKIRTVQYWHFKIAFVSDWWELCIHADVRAHMRNMFIYCVEWRNKNLSKKSGENERAKDKNN